MKTKKMQLANCKGNLVIFSYDRIKSDEVLSGLHKYDLQSDDYGFDPIGIKESVLVHHWGTLITKNPLPLNKSGWLLINQDDDFMVIPHIRLTQKEFQDLPEVIINAFLNNEPQEKQYAHHQI